MSQQSDFETTPVNRVRQVAKRGHYDRGTINTILDASLVGQVAFSTKEGPFSIPMLFARRGEELLFHGSTKSRLMKMLAGGETVCVSVTVLDGLVLAKSLFHHSMNYRSVCVFGSGYEIVEPDEKTTALQVISDKTMPGRWEDARGPSEQELKATSVVAVRMEHASAKVRTGEPVDDEKDQELPVWTGVIPFEVSAGMPIRNPQDNIQSPVPGYIEKWISHFNASQQRSDVEEETVLTEMESYVPRQTEMMGVREINGWQMKVYRMKSGKREFDGSVVEEALRFLSSSVKWPNRKHGYGFVTVHFGDSIWLLCDVWVDDILRHFVFRSSYDAPTRFRHGPADGTTACVWELEVTKHERDAWVNHVMTKSDSPDFDGYLKDGLGIAVQSS